MQHIFILNDLLFFSRRVVWIFLLPLCIVLFTLHLSARSICRASPCDPQAPHVCSATLVIITAGRGVIDCTHIHAGTDATLFIYLFSFLFKGAV